MSIDAALWFSVGVFYADRSSRVVKVVISSSVRLMLRPQPDCGTIYLYRKPVDMRKAINGLVAIVEGQMSLDPFSANLFVFCNNNRSIIKCVYWEGNGFALWMKRLEKARFQWPTKLPMDVVDLNAQQVNWLFDVVP